MRVHKTRAVVRLMFFNPDDVRWFKPLELWTKSGRRGRITEPLGTHGAFKARFDGPITQVWGGELEFGGTGRSHRLRIAVLG